MVLKDEVIYLIIKELKEIKTAMLVKQKVLDNPIIGEDEFIKIMGITKLTAKKWRETGETKYLTVGNNIYYKRLDIQQLLNKKYNGENPIILNKTIANAA